MENVRIPKQELKQMIRQILIDKPVCRDSDRILYYEVLKELGQENIAVYDLLFDRKVPNYDSVSRLRRLVQRTYPELCGSERAEEGRIVGEGQWHDLMRRKYKI